MKRFFFILILLFALAIVIKIVEFFYVCNDKEIIVNPIWSKNLNGYLKIKNDTLEVHKNFYYKKNDEDEVIYLLNLKTGEEINRVFDNKYLIKTTREHIFKNEEIIENSNLFFTDVTFSEKFLIKLDNDYSIFLCFKRYNLRCNSSYYYIKIYKQDKKFKEFYIDYVFDYVDDKDGICIRTFTENGIAVIKRYLYSDLINEL